jgi:hypothetical protein
VIPARRRNGPDLLLRQAQDEVFSLEREGLSLEGEGLSLEDRVLVLGNRPSC